MSLEEQLTGCSSLLCGLTQDDPSCLSGRPPAGLSFIDHIVGNQPDDQMVPVTDW